MGLEWAVISKVTAILDTLSKPISNLLKIIPPNKTPLIFNNFQMGLGWGSKR